MGTLMERTFPARSPRIASRHSIFRHVARYADAARADFFQSAQYDDISSTGMLLVSRVKNHAQVGDLINVEFSLPGTGQIFMREARVVRVKGDFELGVHFVDSGSIDERNYVDRLTQYAEYLSHTRIERRPTGVERFFVKHQSLIIMAFAMVALVAAVGLLLFLSSEYYPKPQPVWRWGKWGLG